MGVLHLLGLLIEPLPTSSTEDFSSKLGAIGEAVETLSRCKIEVFRDLMFQVIRNWCAASIVDCEQILERRGRTPTYAVTVVQMRIARLELASSEPRYALPVEFTNSENPWREIAELFSMYGQLLQAWPTLVRVMRSNRRAS